VLETTRNNHGFSLLETVVAASSDFVGVEIGPLG
jgi:hypothetical protein